jgi:hypothetical protein
VSAGYPCAPGGDDDAYVESHRSGDQKGFFEETRGRRASPEGAVDSACNQPKDCENAIGDDNHQRQITCGAKKYLSFPTIDV